MNSNFRNLAIWIIIALLLVALFNLVQNNPKSSHSTGIEYSQFLTDVDAGNVRSATISGNQITGTLASGQPYQTYMPNDPQLIERLHQKGVRFDVKPASDEVPSLLGILVNWFPMLLLIAVWVFFMRQMQSGGGRALGFGKSKAKLLTEKQGRVTFDDVAGVDEAKDDLQEIVEFLRDPQKFQRLGGRIPRGALLVGPPGTGKTLLARAIAGEANVPFFTISGSDFVEMFVGVGASRVRDMFEQAKEERALHHLYRRNRRSWPPSRSGSRRRQRRARADAEPAPCRDGRLRSERGHHPHRGHEPPRRARSRAVASWPLRPAGRRACARYHRPREDLESARAQSPARSRCRSQGHSARHSRLLRRGSFQISSTRPRFWPRAGPSGSSRSTSSRTLRTRL